MLDTIAINLQRNEFTIHCPERFTPHAGALNSPFFGGGGIVKCIYHPTKKEKAQGYLPRLTLFKKPYGSHSESVWLRIEFSAPKLVFGNNFEELRGIKDFENVISVLLEALNRMGIKTIRDTLIKARVTAIHYSKNIMLDRDTPCHLLIQTLGKADMNGRLDISQSVFRNGGQMAKYHASTYEICLYDKMKDLEQARKFGSKRGAEMDYDCQTDLFKGRIKPEVLRFEVRLTSKKLKPLLGTLGVKRDLTLKNLFCSNLSRAVLLHYWDTITKGLYIMNIETKFCEKLADKIRAKFPTKRPNSVLALMGFIITCQQMGARGAKLMLRLNDSQFYRLKADAQKLEQDCKCPRFRALGMIRKQLEEIPR